MKRVIFLFLVAISVSASTPTTNFSPTSAFCKDCDNINAIPVIIEEAIAVGAPTYNAGNHIGCYRVDEGTVYKILYKYGSKCKKVKSILETALEKAYRDNTATEKAWVMRVLRSTLFLAYQQVPDSTLI